jgi:hypothetical protein
MNSNKKKVIFLIGVDVYIPIYNYFQHYIFEMTIPPNEIVHIIWTNNSSLSVHNLAYTCNCAPPVKSMKLCTVVGW